MSNSAEDELNSFGSAYSAPILEIDQVAAIERSVKSGQRDPQGITGANPHAVSFISGSGSASDSSSQMRLYRTGAMGFEPTLGIDRAGSIYVPTVTCVGGQSCSRPQVLRSQDGGSHWSEVTPTLGGQAVQQLTQDPYLYVDQRTDRLFWDNLILPCSQLSFSDDKGSSWAHQVVGCDQTDHQTIFAGPAPKGASAPHGYANVVYYCAMNAGGLYGAGTSHATTCAKSLDGGRSFTLTGQPAYIDDPSGYGDFGLPGACNGGTGKGAVGPDGTIYLPRGWCGRPYVSISKDEGFSWQRVQVSTLGMNTLLGGGPDHNAGVGVDAQGNVYFAWVARNRQPYLSVSRDGGQHWSTPAAAGPPGLRQANMPSIAVGAPGKVAISFMGSTDAPAAPFPDDGTCPARDPQALATCSYSSPYGNVTWGGFLVQTVNALAAAPTFVGGQVNDPARPFLKGECGPGKCQAEYDFLHAVISPRDGTAYAVFVDGCRGEQSCGGIGEVVLGRITHAARLS